MTRDELIAMAREAGFRTGQINLSNGVPQAVRNSAVDILIVFICQRNQ
jgi:hypothetical protein